MTKKLQVYKCEKCGNIVEMLADGKAYRQFLNPGDEPVAHFSVKAGKVSAREYCNLHGLWKGAE